MGRMNFDAHRPNGPIVFPIEIDGVTVTGKSRMQGLVKDPRVDIVCHCGNLFQLGWAAIRSRKDGVRITPIMCPDCLKKHASPRKSPVGRDKASPYRVVPKDVKALQAKWAKRELITPRAQALIKAHDKQTELRRAA